MCTNYLRKPITISASEMSSSMKIAQKNQTYIAFYKAISSCSQENIITDQNGIQKFVYITFCYADLQKSITPTGKCGKYISLHVYLKIM
jgi:hypothetical protein